MLDQLASHQVVAGRVPFDDVGALDEDVVGGWQRTAGNRFDEAADRLADDLDLAPEFVTPLEDVPSVPDLPAGIELVVYIGRDRA